jgi:AcrR family transcriptional regulator
MRQDTTRDRRRNYVAGNRAPSSLGVDSRKPGFYTSTMDSSDTAHGAPDADRPARRPRGRPQVRTDDETLRIIIAAAREAFMTHGFAATNMAAVAHKAGISTKTMYRLTPTKVELFHKVVASRIESFTVALDIDALDALSPRDGLVQLLTLYGELILGAEAIGLFRLAVTEGGRFPEIAAAFYETAIEPSGRAIAAWLSRQCERGAIRLDDPAQASGMLRGMMAMEGQRAALLGRRPLPGAAEIAARARACAELFLDGCALKPT